MTSTMGPRCSRLLIAWVGEWDAVFAGGGLQVASPYEMDPSRGELDIIMVGG